MKRLLFLPLLLVVFAGCGMTETTNQRAAPAAAVLTEARAADPPVAAPDGELASRRGTLDDEEVRLTLTQLRRTGTATSLGIRLTKPTNNWNAAVAGAFDDGATQPIRGSESEENGTSLDGIYLIDAVNGRKYLVARDGDGRCVCDAGLKETFVDDDGAPLNLSATFGAPPPDVHAIDVFVPHFGTFANVPLG